MNWAMSALWVRWSNRLHGIRQHIGDWSPRRYLDIHGIRHGNKAGRCVFTRPVGLVPAGLVYVLRTDDYEQLIEIIISWWLVFPDVD